MPMRKKFTHVIFDLDGTLLNTLDDLADACNWLCEQHGWPTHALKEYCYFIGNGAAKLVERTVPEHARTPEQLPKLLEEYTAYYNLHKSDKTCAYEGVPRLLEQHRTRFPDFPVSDGKLYFTGDPSASLPMLSVRRPRHRMKDIERAALLFARS